MRTPGKDCGYHPAQEREAATAWLSALESLAEVDRSGALELPLGNLRPRDRRGLA